MLAKRTLNIASAVLALLIVALLVWDASDAAFVATTDGEAGEVGTVELYLVDDDPWGANTLADVGSSTFTPVLGPGDSASECIVIDYSSSSATYVPTGETVKVYAQLAGNATGAADLGDTLTLRIDEVDDCTNRAVQSTPFSVAAVETIGSDWATGTDLAWSIAAPTDSKSYLITFALPATADDGLQGQAIQFQFDWELRVGS